MTEKLWWPLICHHEVDGHGNMAHRTLMTIHLKPELEEMIKQDVQRGPYQSVDEFVQRAVEMLHEEEALLAGDRQLINEKIERAFAQFERGEGLSPEESRARLQEAKKAWLKQQRP
jgi:putative addiction module CopG family antidote